MLKDFIDIETVDGPSKVYATIVGPFAVHMASPSDVKDLGFTWAELYVVTLIDPCHEARVRMVPFFFAAEDDALALALIFGREYAAGGVSQLRRYADEHMSSWIGIEA